MTKIDAKIRDAKSLQSAEEKFSFSFYDSDLQSLKELQAVLASAGISADRTKIVRCLLHTILEVDLFAYSVALHRADAAKVGPREEENVAERFTVVLLKSDVERVKSVLAWLEEYGIVMNTSYALRALLRGIPRTAALAPVFQKYLEKFPDGRSRAARARRDE
jgi:hypothetical protein